MWENPAFADFLHGLASFSRLILLDHLGRGLSDRGPNGRPFEDRMDDIRAVLRAVGSDAAASFGCHLGGRLALLFAATHPQHTTAVVTFAAHPATLRDPEYPWGSTPEQREELLAAVRSGELEPEGHLDELAPSAAADPAMRRWFTIFVNSAVTPPEAVDEVTSHGPVDIRGLLGSVRVPALVLHRTGDRLVSVEAGRYLADRLPRARLVELPGEDHLPYVGDQEGILRATEEFLTGTARVPDPARAVLTVMFTDIVGSTELAGRLGDRRWRLLHEQHDELVRSVLDRSGAGRSTRPATAS